MIDATPDVVPVIDAIESCPGLFLATGFSGHGFGIGPGAGKVIADLITGHDTGYDLSRLRFSRFSGGSKCDRPGILVLLSKPLKRTPASAYRPWWDE